MDKHNKSLEIDLRNLVTNGSVKRQYQSVNKKTLKIEQNQVQDPRLIKKEEEEEKIWASPEEEEIDWTSPMLQSQLYPEEEKVEEKNQDSSPQPKEDSIFKKRRTKYTATRIKYSPTRIKSRNFLSNVSYTGINKGDFYNKNFILDVFILLVKNLNPFSL